MLNIPIQGTGDREVSFHISSSSFLNTIIFVSNRYGPVTMDKRQFLERIFNVTTSKIIMNVVQ